MQYSNSGVGCCHLKDAVCCDGSATIMPTGDAIQNCCPVTYTCRATGKYSSVCDPPAPATNATAIAALQVCTPGPRYAPADPVANPNGMPSLIVIGDSVSIGYTPDLTALLKASGTYFVQHSPWATGGGAADTKNGRNCIGEFLRSADFAPQRWDTVVFNFGLHDLSNTTTAYTAYKANLESITDAILAAGPKRVLYVLTTPMMENYNEGNFAVEHNNDVAAQIMAARNVPTVDLYKTVTDHCGTQYVDCDICAASPCSYHYKGQGYPMLAAALQAAIQNMTAAPAAAAAAAPASTTGDLGCFVQKASSSTVKNICERSFDAFLSTTNAEACAEKCIADSTCVSFAYTSTSPQCRISATCTAPTSAVPGFDGYFRNSTSGACASPPAPAPKWRRVNLDDAAAKGAVCIDGSPGVFYIRTTNANGTAPANPGKWVIFMEGGGWTSSDSASVGRSKTDLGSSKNYPPGEQFEPGYEGTYMFQHAPFDDATIVYNKYCDGGSWTGALSNPPRVVDNTTLYYRGRGLLDGIFDELYTNHSLSAAKEVTLSGCSAGGLTTYVHADAVTARVKARSPHAKIVAIADAMFSLNHDNFAKDGHWPRFMQWVYSNMDPSGDSVNEACVVAMAAKYGIPAGNRSEGWRCMFGASIINHITTPTFVLNSKYDTWQGAQIIGANNCRSNVSSCPANLTQFWVDYGHTMVESLDAMPVRHGAYVHNCQSHCQTGLSPDYNEDTVRDAVSGSSINMGDAVNAWYVAAMAGKPEAAIRHIDRCDVLPCAGDICHGVGH